MNLFDKLGVEQFKTTFAVPASQTTITGLVAGDPNSLSVTSWPGAYAAGRGVVASEALNQMATWTDFTVSQMYRAAPVGVSNATLTALELPLPGGHSFSNLTSANFRLALFTTNGYNNPESPTLDVLTTDRGTTYNATTQALSGIFFNDQYYNTASNWSKQLYTVSQLTTVSVDDGTGPHNRKMWALNPASAVMYSPVRNRQSFFPAVVASAMASTLVGAVLHYTHKTLGECRVTYSNALSAMLPSSSLAGASAATSTVTYNNDIESHDFAAFVPPSGKTTVGNMSIELNTAMSALALARLETLPADTAASLQAAVETMANKESLSAAFVTLGVPATVPDGFETSTVQKITILRYASNGTQISASTPTIVRVPRSSRDAIRVWGTAAQGFTVASGQSQGFIDITATDYVAPNAFTATTFATASGYYDAATDEFVFKCGFSSVAVVGLTGGPTPPSNQMSVSYSYTNGGGGTVSLVTRDQMGLAADGVTKKVLTDASQWGKIVSGWTPVTAAQIANKNKITSVSAGTYAVKYHVDYVRVLEDALDAKVVASATKIMYYAGQLNIVSQLSTQPLAATSLDTHDIAALLDLNPDGSVKSGGFYKVTTDAGGLGVVKITNGAVDGAIEVRTGDAFIVKEDKSLEKVDNSDPVVSAAVGAPIDVTFAGEKYTLDLTADFKKSVTDVIAGLAAEIARAGAAETALGVRIDDEITARTAADTALDVLIKAETTRATAAENALATDLANEVTRATTAENTLTTDLNQEVQDRIAGDNTLRADLTAEVANRQTAVSAEATARSNADTVLQGNIDAEETRAKGEEARIEAAYKAADAIHTADIALEIDNRTAADNALDAKISKLAGSFNLSVKSVVDDLKVVKAFIAATEQFVEITSDGSTVLDFASSIGGFYAGATIDVLATSVPAAGADFVAA